MSGFRGNPETRHFLNIKCFFVCSWCRTTSKYVEGKLWKKVGKWEIMRVGHIDSVLRRISYDCFGNDAIVHLNVFKI